LGGLVRYVCAGGTVCLLAGASGALFSAFSSTFTLVADHDGRRVLVICCSAAVEERPWSIMHDEISIYKME